MAELRQRSKKPNDEATPTDRVEFIKAASTRAPSSLQPWITKAAPVIVTVWGGIEAAVPFFILAKKNILELSDLAKPYHPDDLLPALCGLAMVFFGGDFPMLIATVVAFQETGSWKAMRRALTSLWGEGEHVFRASKADDEKDDDGDGTPDVQQIEAKEVVTRKLFLVVKVVNPDTIGAAITAVSAGSLTVLAALKLEFARTLSLGASLGHTLEKPAKRYFTPVLKEALDPEYHKWVSPIIQYGCKMATMTFAFWLQRLIAAVHSAINGGQLFTSSAARYLNKYQVISFDPDNSNLDEMAGYGVAAVGLYYQFFYGTPFLLSLLMLPLTLCEWAIRLTLSFM